MSNLARIRKLYRDDRYKELNRRLRWERVTILKSFLNEFETIYQQLGKVEVLGGYRGSKLVVLDTDFDIAYKFIEKKINEIKTKLKQEEK